MADACNDGQLREAITQALAAFRLRSADDSMLEAIGRAAIILTDALNPDDAIPPPDPRDAEIAQLRNVLRAAGHEIGFLHAKFGETGSGNATLALIALALGSKP